MFKAGFAQFCPVRRGVERNISILENILRGVEADLLVLPELANSGYLYATPEDLAPYAESGDGSGPFLTALQKLAAQTGGVLVAGFAEKSADGLYNSAAAVDGAGVIQVYRKTHLFAGEKELFLPGDSGFQIFEHRGVRIGMMVCFDWIFPESARTLALKGAQIIAHPANLVLPFCQQAMVTRSLENAVFSITANRYGLEELGEKKLRFTGGSQLLDTKGRRLLQAPADDDCLAVADIDPTAADDKLMTANNDLFLDRRPEMYYGVSP
jgi:predicted amidohydrolase